MPIPTIDHLFPKGSRLLLTGGGKAFIERIGVEAAKNVVLGILMGENVRAQTEPLTRRRIAQVSGAMIVLFMRGLSELDDFGQRLSDMAEKQIAARKNDRASLWLAQWLLGLTGKSVQNVLRSDPKARRQYISDFETAIAAASEGCRQEFGDVRMTLGYAQDGGGLGRCVELDWRDITRLTTAIGSLTLTIRGSDKSIYGKLFERLVLGSVLTILGFQRVDRATNTKPERVFWLSDSSDVRECDATLLYQMGKVVRFDIGFIGPGNPEISKDKLTRYASHLEFAGNAHASHTFIVVDRLPPTGKTRQAAENIGAEIIQMSMRYWPKDLANRLRDHVGFKHKLQSMPEGQIRGFLEQELSRVEIQDFLTGISVSDVANAVDACSADEAV